MSDKPNQRVVYRVSHKTFNCTEHSDFDSPEKRAANYQRGFPYRFSTVRITTRPKLHGFAWAFKQMKAGKRVRRAGWANPKYYISAAEGTLVALEDMLQTDWQLAPGET